MKVQYSPQSTKVQLVAVDFDPFEGPPIAKTFPVTEAQKEIWLSAQMSPEANSAYNENLNVYLYGDVQVEFMLEAITLVINRHEALRSVFTSDGELMVVHANEKNKPAYIDLSYLPSSELRNQRLSEILALNVEQPFDLYAGPLFKAQLLKLDANEFVLDLCGHHSVTDGWSLGIIVQDISSFYSAKLLHAEPVLQPVVQFSTYANDLAEYSKTQENKRVHLFWQKQYESNVPVLNIPVDRPYKSLRTYEGQRYDAIMDRQLADAIKKIGAKQGATFVNTLFAMFEVFMYHLTQQTSLVIGLPSAGQSEAGYHHLVGHCVNLLPIRAEIEPSQTFASFLAARKSCMLDALENQRFTFSKLLQTLTFERDPGRIPLVPVVFNIDMNIDDGVNFNSLRHLTTSNPRKFENFELFINVTGHADNLTVEYSYNTWLFNPSSIQRFAAGFNNLCQAIVQNPSLPLSAYSLLTPNELHKTLFDWNKTQRELPRDVFIQHYLENHANQNPEKPALVFEEQVFTYKVLNHKANVVAHQLLALGIEPHTRIAIFIERSPATLFAIYGVLKAGCTFIPLDPLYPKGRIEMILQDSDPGLILTDGKIKNLLPIVPTKIICIEDLLESDSAPENPEVQVDSDSLAYIIFTSGSTGRPKGVMIKHIGLFNFLHSMLHKPGLNSKDGFLAVTTISFDIAYLELFGPAMAGGCVILADSDAVRNAELLTQLIAKEEVTICQATPVTWKMLQKMHWPGKTNLKILSGGEALSVDLASYLLGCGSEIWNMYGPTETSIWSSVYCITNQASLSNGKSIVPIGYPIDNTSMYVLSATMQAVMPYVRGSLYIGGKGLANGYYGNAALSLEKFIPNPFVANDTMYQTGDNAFFDENGCLYYAGRDDNQLKIRGYRIEPGEIEQAVLRYQGISGCVVNIIKNQHNSDVLVAWCIVNTGCNMNNSVLQAFLRAYLPVYMIPTLFEVVSTFPLTPNGKINRKALPMPRFEQSKSSGTQVENPSQQFLLSIWQKLLANSHIGLDDDFFALGGHSLLAVDMMLQIEKETHIRLPLASLFKYPTIRALSQIIAKGGKEEDAWSSLVPIKTSGSMNPLFIIHGAGLNIFLFNTLANHMDADQPVYGLQAKGLNGTDQPLKTVFDMAAYYVSEIRKVKPTGPYNLAGFSLGGIIAFEMALQLIESGDSVSFLGLFDTVAFTSKQYFSKSKRIKRSLIELGGVPFFNCRQFCKNPKRTWYDKSKKYRDQLLRLYWTLKGDKVSVTKEGLPLYALNVRRASDQAAENYQLGYFPGTIDLFRALGRSFFVHDPKYLDWEQHCRAVETHDIPGDHSKIFAPPNDAYFAVCLQKRLRQLEETSQTN